MALVTRNRRISFGSVERLLLIKLITLIKLSRRDLQ